MGQVNTGPSYYEGCPIKYLGLDLIDLPVANIKKHFDSASEFIASAVCSNGKYIHKNYLIITCAVFSGVSVQTLLINKSKETNKKKINKNILLSQFVWLLHSSAAK